MAGRSPGRSTFALLHRTLQTLGGEHISNFLPRKTAMLICMLESIIFLVGDAAEAHYAFNNVAFMVILLLVKAIETNPSRTNDAGKTAATPPSYPSLDADILCRRGLLRASPNRLTQFQPPHLLLHFACGTFACVDECHMCLLFVVEEFAEFGDPICVHDPIATQISPAFVHYIQHIERLAQSVFQSCYLGFRRHDPRWMVVMAEHRIDMESQPRA